MMRLNSDLVELCLLALKGKLDTAEIAWDPRPALGVVLAAGGYPDAYNKGDVITGLPTDAGPDCKVFHAGTRQQQGQIITAGGRVLCACALGDNLAQAQRKAYELTHAISWNQVYYRNDIGFKALD
jgi:phosphoribosylamine--glycine ligase